MGPFPGTVAQPGRRTDYRSDLGAASGGVDLVLYDADPLESIDAVGKPSAVWKAGELVAGG